MRSFIFLRIFFFSLIIGGLASGAILLFHAIQLPWEGQIQKASLWAGAILGLTGLPFGALFCIVNQSDAKITNFSQGDSITKSTKIYGRALIGVLIYFFIEASAGRNRGESRIAFFHQNAYLAYPFLTLMSILAFYFSFKYAAGIACHKITNLDKK